MSYFGICPSRLCLERRAFVENIPTTAHNKKEQPEGKLRRLNTHKDGCTHGNRISLTRRETVQPKIALFFHSGLFNMGQCACSVRLQRINNKLRSLASTSAEPTASLFHSAFQNPAALTIEWRAPLFAARQEELGRRGWCLRRERAYLAPGTGRCRRRQLQGRSTLDREGLLLWDR